MDLTTDASSAPRAGSGHASLDLFAPLPGAGEFDQRYFIRQLAEDAGEVIFVSDVGCDGASTSWYVNRAYEKVWGRTRKSFYEHPDSWLDAVIPEEHERVAAAWQRSTVEPLDEQFHIRTPAGMTHVVHMRVFSIKGRAGEIYRTVAMAEGDWSPDPVDVKWAANERRWSQMVDAAQEGICVIDEQWRYAFVNAAMAKLVGCTSREIIGRHMLSFVAEFVDKEDQAVVLEQMYRREHGLVVEYDLRLRSRDGSLVWTIVNSTPLVEPGGRFSGALSTITNVTRRMLAEQALELAREELERKVEERTAELRKNNETLRVMSSQLAMAEERERHRIASDLHDSIGQNLGLCKIKLGLLGEEVPSPGGRQLVNELREFVSRLIHDVRGIASELSSPLLYELGFEAAVEWLLERLEKQHGIHTRFADDRLPKPLDDDVRVVLFQAVRELVLNIARHASAQNASLRIEKKRQTIRVVVQDDGIGFDASRIGFHPHSDLRGLGLVSIKQRLEMCGGRLDIRSSAKRGTRIMLTAPLKQMEATGNGDARHHR